MLSYRETVPVFLSLWDIPHHSMIFVEGFVKLISRGSVFLPPRGQVCNGVDCPQVGMSRVWVDCVREQLDSSTLHFFEQGFEKEGAFLGHWLVF